MYVVLLSCLALILQLFPPVVSTPTISSPGALKREVGQDVVFMFNSSSEILGFNWGIQEGDTNNLKQGLVKKLAGGIQLDNTINSTSYAGRVSFVGDLSKGQAWFKITNLNINDTNQYLAKIYAKEASEYDFFSVKLIVIMPPLTSTAYLHTTAIRTDTVVIVASTTTIPLTTEAILSSAPTTSILIKESEVSDSNCTSVIATSVTINVLLVLVVVFLVAYIWRRKRKVEKEANARSPNVKDEELGVYENENQVEETAFDKASQATRPAVNEKEIYETILNNENGSKNKSHRPEDETKGTSLELSTGVNEGHSAIQSQHYQDLNRATSKPLALYESLEQRNMGNNGNKLVKESTTYEPLQPNKAETDYQSLNNAIKNYPNSESKV